MCHHHKVVMGDDKKAEWMTEDRFMRFGMGLFVMLLFLKFPHLSYLLPAALYLVGSFSVFLTGIGVYEYFFKKKDFTLASGIAMGFLITLFFGPEYVLPPILLVLGLVQALF